MNINLRDAIIARATDYVDAVRDNAFRSLSDRKIEQIKYVRERTGFGLKDSKDIVETDNEDSRMSIIRRALEEALGGEHLPAPVRPADNCYVIGKDNFGDAIVYEGHSLEEGRRVMSFLANRFNAVEFAITRPV